MKKSQTKSTRLNRIPTQHFRIYLRNQDKKAIALDFHQRTQTQKILNQLQQKAQKLLKIPKSQQLLYLHGQELKNTSQIQYNREYNKIIVYAAKKEKVVRQYIVIYLRRLYKLNTSSQPQKINVSNQCRIKQFLYDLVYGVAVDKFFMVSLGRVLDLQKTFYQENISDYSQIFCLHSRYNLKQQIQVNNFKSKQKINKKQSINSPMFTSKDLNQSLNQKSKSSEKQSHGFFKKQNSKFGQYYCGGQKKIQKRNIKIDNAYLSPKNESKQIAKLIQNNKQVYQKITQLIDQSMIIEMQQQNNIITTIDHFLQAQLIWKEDRDLSQLSMSSSIILMDNKNTNQVIDSSLVLNKKQQLVQYASSDSETIRLDSSLIIWRKQFDGQQQQNKSQNSQIIENNFKLPLLNTSHFLCSQNSLDDSILNKLKDKEQSKNQSIIASSQIIIPEIINYYSVHHFQSCDYKFELQQQQYLIEKQQNLASTKTAGTAISINQFTPLSSKINNQINEFPSIDNIISTNQIKQLKYNSVTYHQTQMNLETIQMKKLSSQKISNTVIVQQNKSIIIENQQSYQIIQNNIQSIIYNQYSQQKLVQIQNNINKNSIDCFNIN